MISCHIISYHIIPHDDIKHDGVPVTLISSIHTSDTDSKYISTCLSLGLLNILCSSMDRNVYEVNTQGGYCLCCMAVDCSVENAKTVLGQVSYLLNFIFPSCLPSFLPCLPSLPSFLPSFGFLSSFHSYSFVLPLSLVIITDLGTILLS